MELEEIKLKDFLKKKETGSLLVNAKQKQLEESLQQVNSLTRQMAFCTSPIKSFFSTTSQRVSCVLTPMIRFTRRRMHLR